MDYEVLASLTPPDRAHVLSRCTEEHFTRGEAILREGEPGDKFHLIESGRVSLHVATHTGESAMLSVLSPGQAFGEMALVGARTRTATAIALEDVTTRAMSSSLFDELRRSHPAVDRLLVDILASRVDRLSRELTEALYLPVDVRLARRLLSLSAVYRNADEPAVIPLTQQEISELVGATRPTVNLELNGLADSGAVRLERGRITIVDVDALRERASGRP
ncbi:MAG: Crp/Fnr family transcriptional regulator [Mycobacteriales bacterium]